MSNKIQYLLSRKQDLFGSNLSRCLALDVCLFLKEDRDNAKEYARYNNRDDKEPVVIRPFKRSCAIWFLDEMINAYDEKIAQC